MGPGSQPDLLSVVSFLIFGQLSALGIYLLDRFLAIATACVGFGVRVCLILRVGILGGWAES